MKACSNLAAATASPEPPGAARPLPRPLPRGADLVPLPLPRDTAIAEARAAEAI